MKVYGITKDKTLFLDNRVSPFRLPRKPRASQPYISRTDKTTLGPLLSFSFVWGLERFPIKASLRQMELVCTPFSLDNKQTSCNQNPIAWF